MTAKDRRIILSWNDIPILGLLFIGWWVGSMDEIVKFFPGKTVAVCGLAAICIALVLGWTRWLQSNGSAQIHYGWLAALWLVLTITYLVLYPISQRHVVGVGSDSEDALRVATGQLLHCHFPYYEKTYLGNPITPLPGALLLATPFYLLGRVSLQNPIWLAIFIVFCVRFFRARSTAVAFLLIFVVGSAIALDEFVVGTDYVTNVWYICALTYFSLQAYETRWPEWQQLVLGLLFGLALSSRVVYAVFPVLMLAYLLQRGRIADALYRVAVPLAVAVAVTLPIYLYDRGHFSPLHVQEKLDFLPAGEARVLLLALPVLGMLTACAGFLVRLTIPRLYLTAGIAMGIILIPPAVLECLKDHLDWGLVGYGIASFILIGLWAMSRFEESLNGTLGSS